MKCIYKFLSLLTISVLILSSYAAYAEGCCCVKKDSLKKTDSVKSEMPCHKDMAKADDTSGKQDEKGNCCSGKCDCKFTLSVKLPTASADGQAENIEFSFLYFYTNQIFNSVSPESLDDPPKA